MRAHTLTLTLLASIGVMILGFFGAEYIAEPFSSVWLAAAFGFVLAMVLSAVEAPILLRAAKEGYLPDRSERVTLRGTLFSILLACLIGYLLIVEMSERFDGTVAYAPPYVGGFIIGQIAFTIVDGLRKKAKTS